MRKENHAKCQRMEIKMTNGEKETSRVKKIRRAALRVKVGQTNGKTSEELLWVFFSFFFLRGGGQRKKNDQFMGVIVV